MGSRNSFLCPLDGQWSIVFADEPLHISSCFRHLWNPISLNNFQNIVERMHTWGPKDMPVCTLNLWCRKCLNPLPFNPLKCIRNVLETWWNVAPGVSQVENVRGVPMLRFGHVSSLTAHVSSSKKCVSAREIHISSCFHHLLNPINLTNIFQSIVECIHTWGPEDMSVPTLNLCCRKCLSPLCFTPLKYILDVLETRWNIFPSISQFGNVTVNTIWRFGHVLSLKAHVSASKKLVSSRELNTGTHPNNWNCY